MLEMLMMLPPAGGHHRADEGLADRIEPDHVAGRRALPGINGLRLEAAGGGIAHQRAVDQHLDVPEAVDHLGVKALDRRRVADVQLHAVHLGAGLPGQRRRVLLVARKRARCGDHARPGFRQRLRDAAAEQRPRPGGHHRRLAAQRECVKYTHGAILRVRAGGRPPKVRPPQVTFTAI